MQKKKFDLTADLVDVSDEKTSTNHLSQQVEKNLIENKGKNILLTISVEESFRAEFKSWCARHRLKMNEAVIKGFQLLKEKEGS